MFIVSKKNFVKQRLSEAADANVDLNAQDKNRFSALISGNS